MAPVDGTVGIRVAEPGEIVPGKPVMTLEVDGEPLVRLHAARGRLEAIEGRK